MNNDIFFALSSGIGSCQAIIYKFYSSVTWGPVGPSEFNIWGPDSKCGGQRPGGGGGGGGGPPPPALNSNPDIHTYSYIHTYIYIHTHITYNIIIFYYAAISDCKVMLSYVKVGPMNSKQQSILMGSCGSKSLSDVSFTGLCSFNVHDADNVSL